MMSVHTNMSFLKAHRNFGMQQDMVQKSLQRISSGSRINSAADDPAGLGVSEKMRAQIRGLGKEIENCQRSMSMLQTAEGGLNEAHSILGRMKELAAMASDATLTDEDRYLANIEYQAMIQELNQISRTTTFNGIQLLGGDQSNQGKYGALQLGILEGSFGGSYAGSGEGKLVISSDSADSATLTLKINGEMVSAVLEGKGDVVFTLGDGSNVTLTGLDTAKLCSGSLEGVDFSGNSSVLANATATLRRSGISVGTSTDEWNLSVADVRASNLGNTGNGSSLADTDILTQEGARKANELVELASKQVSAMRAGLGASINRLEHTISRMQMMEQNLTDAESIIRDADIAKEMMEYTKHSILTQAAQAMMSHALQEPNQIITLINSL